MRRTQKADLDAAMKVHVSATMAVAQALITAAAAHRPLTLPELQKAEAHFLDMTMKSLREKWAEQGFAPGTLALFASSLEAHYRKLFAERFYDSATLATMDVGVRT